MILFLSHHFSLHPFSEVLKWKLLFSILHLFSSAHLTIDHDILFFPICPFLICFSPLHLRSLILKKRRKRKEKHFLFSFFRFILFFSHHQNLLFSLFASSPVVTMIMIHLYSSRRVFALNILMTASTRLSQK